MKNYSIWKDNIKFFDYKKLSNDIDVDVLIIGGGMSGINTLYQLKDSTLKVILLEQNKVGMGVSANTTGKITYLQDNLYEKIIKNFDRETASIYLSSQRCAIDILLDIIKKEKIKCNLIKAPSFVFSNSFEENVKLLKLKKFLISNNIKIIEKDNNLVDYKLIIGVEGYYLFHPLKYINGLLKVIDKNNIYENTSVIKIDKFEDGYICYTNDNVCIKAKKVVIASHYPYFTLPFLFPVKVSLEKSYLSASLYKKDNISIIKYDKPVISMRSYSNYLIYLCNSKDNNSSVDDKHHFDELNKKLNDLKLKPKYIWSNVDIMTSDGLPYIGEIDDNLLIATGYNTWGMTNSVLAGKIIADIIMGKCNEYAKLFNPKRFNFSNVIDVFPNIVKNIKGYANGMINSSNKVEYKFKNNKEIAIYTDKFGKHIVYTKCPHMGCRLIFNEMEKTWDCPCHASRFDIDGKCICGPSNKDISVK